MKIKQEHKQQQKQKTTWEQNIALSESRKNIGYIEMSILERTKYYYHDGEIVKIVHPINPPDEETPDLFDIMNRRR
tara:strand:+ start:1084 stop:1311 length:228 start_codon:yes stop_codon:yes gene_type:complete